MTETILFLGPPAPGSREYLKLKLRDTYYLSTKDMLTRLPTGMGSHINDLMRSGELIPHHQIIGCFTNYLRLLEFAEVYNPSKQTLLLDGIPKTLEQKKEIDGMLHILGAIFIDLPEETCRDWIIHTARIGEGLIGSTPEAMNKRFENYKNFTVPVIDAYRKELGPRFMTICTGDSADKTRSSIENFLNTIKQ